MTQTLDMQSWCYDDALGRYAELNKPVVLDGWLYATNGRVLIRVPSGEPNTVVTKGRLPRLGDPLTGYPSEGFQPWPASSPIIAKGKCLVCDGSGAGSEVECDECNGLGQSTCWECGRTDDCDVCDGEGVTHEGTCEGCNGAKMIERPMCQLVGEAYIDIAFDALVRALPSPEWSQPSGQDTIIFVRFDGGQAAVMPIWKEATQ